MSWEIKVTPGSEKQPGSISAVWTDLVLGVFNYSRTTYTTTKAIDAFIAEVIKARDAWQVTKADDSTVSDSVLSKLNTADSKVI